VLSGIGSSPTFEYIMTVPFLYQGCPRLDRYIYLVQQELSPWGIFVQNKNVPGMISA
jgi:hypothetical protein